MKRTALISLLLCVSAMFFPATAQDFDGDGYSDMAIYHGQSGTWYVLKSSGGAIVQPWGFLDATPVTGDYDGDGRFDFAVYHQAMGNWYILRSSDGQMTTLNFGWAEAVPVPNDYDKDGRTDVAVYYQAMGNWYILLSSLNNAAMATVSWGFIGGSPVVSTLKPVAENPTWASAAVVAETNMTYAVAAVMAGDADVTNATVLVNGVQLAYGLFLTNAVPAEGTVVRLPLYYAQLAGVGAGDTVAMQVFNARNELVYQSGQIVIPGRPAIIAPTNGEHIASGQDATVKWTATTGASVCMAGYASDDDAADVSEMVSTQTVGIVVGNGSLVAGSAVLYASALAWDNEDWLADGNSASFLVAMTPDLVECDVDASVGLRSVPSKAALQIVREYEKRVEGLTFKVRDCNPVQITAPGSVSLTIRFRRFKISVGFVQIYDAQGGKYVDWNYKRIMKSSEKTVTVGWNVSPGSTVVFGTHDASHEANSYVPSAQ